jgi:hypothetical protein
MYTWSERLESQRSLELDAFQHCHPTFELFGGELVDCDIGQSVSSFVQCMQPVFLSREQEDRCTLHEHALKRIYILQHITLVQWTCIATEQPTSIYSYGRYTEMLGYRYIEYRCRNQYHPACLHAEDPLHSVIYPSSTHYTTQYLSGIACITFQLPPRWESTLLSARLLIRDV